MVRSHLWPPGIGFLLTAVGEVGLAVFGVWAFILDLMIVHAAAGFWAVVAGLASQSKDATLAQKPVWATPNLKRRSRGP